VLFRSPGKDTVYADDEDKVNPTCDLAKRGAPRPGADAMEVSH